MQSRYFIETLETLINSCFLHKSGIKRKLSSQFCCHSNYSVINCNWWNALWLKVYSGVMKRCSIKSIKWKWNWGEDGNLGARNYKSLFRQCQISSRLIMLNQLKHGYILMECCSITVSKQVCWKLQVWRNDKCNWAEEYIAGCQMCYISDYEPVVDLVPPISSGIGEKRTHTQFVDDYDLFL